MRKVVTFLFVLSLLMSGIRLLYASDIRISGMGDLEWSIEDENTRIGLYRFGGNPAGLFLDKDENKVYGQYGSVKDSKSGKTDVEYDTIYRLYRMSDAFRMSISHAKYPNLDNWEDFGVSGEYSRGFGSRGMFGLRLGRDEADYELPLREIEIIEPSSGKRMPLKLLDSGEGYEKAITYDMGIGYHIGGGRDGDKNNEEIVIGLGIGPVNLKTESDYIGRSNPYPGSFLDTVYGSTDDSRFKGEGGSSGLAATFTVLSQVFERTRAGFTFHLIEDDYDERLANEDDVTIERISGEDKSNIYRFRAQHEIPAKSLKGKMRLGFNLTRSYNDNKSDTENLDIYKFYDSAGSDSSWIEDSVDEDSDSAGLGYGLGFDFDVNEYVDGFFGFDYDTLEEKIEAKGLPDDSDTSEVEGFSFKSSGNTKDFKVGGEIKVKRIGEFSLRLGFGESREKVKNYDDCTYSMLSVDSIEFPEKERGSLKYTGKEVSRTRRVSGGIEIRLGDFSIEFAHIRSSIRIKGYDSSGEITYIDSNLNKKRDDDEDDFDINQKINTTELALNYYF